MTAPRGSSKAVTDGVLNHVSASQTKTFARCSRLWWYEKVSGLPPPAPPGQSLALGTAVHGEAEDYYLTGKDPSHPSLVKALPHCPPRSPDVQIEAPLDAPKLIASGVPFVGFVDLHLYTPASKEVLILDWKTTSSFSYAKSPEDLRRDVQMIAYAKWAAARYPDATSYHLQHVYLRTKGGSDFRIVRTQATQEDIDTTWQNVEHVVYDMSLVAKKKTAEAVKPNYAECKSYGGCPWASQCPGAGLQKKNMLSLSQSFSEMYPDTGATDMSSLSAKLKGNIVPEAPATTTSTPAPTPGETTSTAGGLVLYVDCIPVKGVDGTTRLEDLIATRSKDLAAANRVADIRLIDYGKGKALLAASFTASPPTGIVTAQSGDLSSPVIEALIPLASVVVRGVR